jgi:hypothetical protein
MSRHGDQASPLLGTYCHASHPRYCWCSGPACRPASNRLTAPLTELLLLSRESQHVVADEFAHLPGAEQVLIFGAINLRTLVNAGLTRRAGAWVLA